MSSNKGLVNVSVVNTENNKVEIKLKVNKAYENIIEVINNQFRL